MLIDNVVVQIDPTLATEDDLKVLVANSKIKFPFGRLAKIVVESDKNGGFNVDFSVKNLPCFWKNQ